MEKQKNYYHIILKLTTPIVLQNLLSAAVNSADVVMLNFVGQAHVSAVSLAAQYANILFMILYGIGSGVTMLSAQYYGKGDLRTVHVVEGIALRFSVGISSFFAICALLFSEQMMRIFTPDTELVMIGAEYLRNISLAYFCWGIIEIYLSTLRSVGKVAVASALNISAFTLNILLNAVFIFGLFGAPKMGAAGVALATTISRVIELILCISYSFINKEIKISLSSMFENNKLLQKDFVKMAMPAVLNDASWSMAFAMYSVVIGQYLGSDVVAANSFVSVARNLGHAFAGGVGSAGGILLGQLIGDNQLEEADKASKNLVKVAIIFGCIGGFVILLSIPILLQFANLTEAGQGYMRTMLFINSYYVIGAALNSTLISGTFRAGGDSRWGFICDTIDMWGYGVPVAFITAAVLKLPPMWVYFFMCTDEFVKWPWVIAHYRSKKWIRNITRTDLYKN